MGRAEKQPRPARRQRRLTTAADFGVAFFVATLLVTSAWKSLWILLDAAVLPGEPLPSAWTSFVFGAVVVYLQTFLRDRLQLAFFGAAAGRARRAAARAVLVLLWLGVVSLWRGIFLLMDIDSGLSWRSYGLFATAGLLILGKLRFLATAAALPLAVDVDLARSFFSHESPLGTTLSDDYHLRTMDAFLALVITFLSTFLWRGIWGILDKIVMPSDHIMSSVISLSLGFGLTSLCYVAQFWVVKRTRSLVFGAGLFVHDALVLLGTVGVVNVWRGVFVFFDTVLSPEVPQDVRLPTAAAITVVSVLLLMTFQLSKNLLLWGVQRDHVGPLPFNCRCLSRILQARSLISYVAPKQTTPLEWKPGQMFVHIPRDTDGKPETLI